MHRLALVGAFLLALCLPDAALAGRVEGKVVHKSKPDAVAGLEVLLIGQNTAGEFSTTTVKSDKDGRFVFDNVLAPAGYLARVRYDGLLHPGPVVELQGAEAAQTIEIPIHDRSEQPSAIELAGTLIYVEPTIGNNWSFGIVLGVTNASDRVVVTPESGQPALRVSLPLGHTAPQAQSTNGPLEIAPQDGALGIRGPIFPGAQQVDVYYELPTLAGKLETELVFNQDTPQAVLLVLDRNVKISAGDLHPAPPANVQGKIYQRYLGFDVPAGTRIPLSVTPLPDLAQPSQWLSALTLSLPFAIFAVLSLLPIAQAYSGRAVAEVNEAPTQQAALLASLADLEHDYEMGKVSLEDRDRLRAELREDTLRELARESAPSAATVADVGAATAVVRKACECGKPVSAADRFCSQCGRPL
jgi:hypothetical protein